MSRPRLEDGSLFHVDEDDDDDDEKSARIESTIFRSERGQRIATMILRNQTEVRTALANAPDAALFHQIESVLNTAPVNPSDDTICHIDDTHISVESNTISIQVGRVLTQLQLEIRVREQGDYLAFSATVRLTSNSPYFRALGKISEVCKDEFIVVNGRYQHSNYRHPRSQHSGSSIYVSTFLSAYGMYPWLQPYANAAERAIFKGLPSRIFREVMLSFSNAAGLPREVEISLEACNLMSIESDRELNTHLNYFLTQRILTADLIKFYGRTFGFERRTPRCENVLECQMETFLATSHSTLPTRADVAIFLSSVQAQIHQRVEKFYQRISVPPPPFPPSSSKRKADKSKEKKKAKPPPPLRRQVEQEDKISYDEEDKECDWDYAPGSPNYDPTAYDE